MSITIKQSGAYVEPAGLLVKVDGVYQVPANIFMKVAGAYQSIISPDVLEVLGRYGADAHLWLPGLGTLSGVEAKNWLDYAGTVPAQEAQPVGKVDDAAAGTIAIAQIAGAYQPILTFGSDGRFSWYFSGVEFFNLESTVFQMTDDACVIAGVSLAAAIQSRTIFGQSTSGNMALPEFMFDATGRLGVYAMGGGATVSSYAGPNNSGAGPIVATLKITSANASVRRNGVEITTLAFSGTYATSDRASIGAAGGPAMQRQFSGNMFPVIVIKGVVSEADIATLENWVGVVSNVQE